LWRHAIQIIRDDTLSALDAQMPRAAGFGGFGRRRVAVS